MHSREDAPVSGSQPSGGPVAVLLVHGIRTSPSMWRHQLDTLRSRGHHVLAVDLPGHGSLIAHTFTAGAARRAIDEGVTALGGRVMLVGLSLGGYWAIDYTATHPHRVIGLVAASCSTLPRGARGAGGRHTSSASYNPTSSANTCRASRTH